MMLWSEETLELLRESRALRRQLATMTNKLSDFEHQLRVIAEKTTHCDGSGEKEVDK
jgi:hypothetical protein